METKIIDYSKYKYNTSTYVASLFQRCAYENSKDLRASIKHLDNINITDKYGNTMLHNASIMLNIELIKFLIENGININAQNNSGNTALHLIMLKKLDRMLLKLDRLDSNHFNNDKKISNIINFFCKHGADINIVNNEGNNMSNVNIKFRIIQHLY